MSTLAEPSTDAARLVPAGRGFTKDYLEMHLSNERGEPLGIKVDGFGMNLIHLTDLVTGSSFTLPPKHFNPSSILGAALSKRAEFRAASF